GKAEQRPPVRARQFKQHQKDEGQGNVFGEMRMASHRDEKARRLVLLAERGGRLGAGAEPDLGAAALVRDGGAQNHEENPQDRRGRERDVRNDHGAPPEAISDSYSRALTLSSASRARPARGAWSRRVPADGVQCILILGAESDARDGVQSISVE